jgi:hypothetical protein
MAVVTAQQKQHYIWDHVRQDQVDPTRTRFNRSRADKLALVTNMNPLFDSTDDVFPDHTKLIHTVGFVARTRFESFNGRIVKRHPFTGVFDTGGAYGIVRMSRVGSRATSQPAVSLKIFRDGGAPSANIIVSSSVNTRNFFGPDLSSAPVPSDIIISPAVIKFDATAPLSLSYLGSHEAASIDSMGRSVLKSCIPFSVRFEPTKELSGSWDIRKDSFSDQMSRVDDNTVLYTLYGLDRPRELGGIEYPIGNLWLTDRLRGSRWADRSLFFRHGRASEVLKTHPEWAQFVSGPVVPKICPFQTPTYVPNLVKQAMIALDTRPWVPRVDRSTRDTTMGILRGGFDLLSREFCAL